MDSAIKRALDVNNYINTKQPIPDGLKHWNGSRKMIRRHYLLNKYLSQTGEPYNIDVSDIADTQYTALSTAVRNISIKEREAVAAQEAVIGLDDVTEQQKNDMEDQYNREYVNNIIRHFPELCNVKNSGILSCLVSQILNRYAV